jgi:hypothetical protein
MFQDFYGIVENSPDDPILISRVFEALSEVSALESPEFIRGCVISNIAAARFSKDVGYALMAAAFYSFIPNIDLETGRPRINGTR